MQVDVWPVSEPAACLLQHPRLAVDANHAAVDTNRVSQPPQIGARAAAEVDCRLPWPHVKRGAQALLVFQTNRCASGAVHIGDLIRRARRRDEVTHSSTKAHNEG